MPIPALLLLTLAALPLGWSLWAAVQAGLDAAAWAVLWRDSQTLRALGMSLWTGLLASALSTLATAWLLCRSFSPLPGAAAGARLASGLAPLLALPHAALAIALVAWLAPSGWLLRLLSPWATGFGVPPPWPTTQDPLGLGLVLVLVLKETPFLLWAALAQLQRPGVAPALQQQLRLAHTLGYGPASAWWRVAWPQLWPRLLGPLLAVLAYNLTVVDVALVIGPGTPPTLAVLAWQWLQDADPATNAQGAAAAWLLAAVLALAAALAWGLTRSRLWRQRWTRGPAAAGSIGRFWYGRRHGERPDAAKPNAPRTPLALLHGIYLAAGLALAVGSISGSWPFPQLLPEAWSWAAWQSVLASSGTLWTTGALALASSLGALLWAVAWLELAPPVWQRRTQALIYLPLALPGVLWVLGLHRLALAWGWDGQAAGLWLAHTLACLPYVLLALQGPYTGFDARLAQLAASLGRSRWVFLCQVKWPLLRAALAASLAVGFAVSVAQYLPTLYVGAGRFNTVTTEAVTLAAGGQRSLTAAYAGLQWLLPVLMFALAAWLGRARPWPQSAPAARPVQCSLP
jgi:putative thiamine transport system permease protein